MLTIITPTGERPEAFDLCQRMLQRQSYAGPVRWIVIDDGKVPQEVWLDRAGWEIVNLRPAPFWRIGDNTQGRNLKAALGLVGADDVVSVWEDDDYYDAGWLQFIADNIGAAELIGERDAVFYNVRKRVWQAIGNQGHGCLRCSAMRGDAIARFREALQKPDRYYDLKLWRTQGDKTAFPRQHTLGMKGLPGRQGIAQGHDGLTGSPDPSLEKLRSLIGGDADWYADFYEHSGIYEDRLYCLKTWGRYRAGDHFAEPIGALQADVYVASGVLTRKTVKAA